MTQQVNCALDNVERAERAVNQAKLSNDPQEMQRAQQQVEQALSALKELKSRADGEEKQVLEQAEHQLLESERSVQRIQSIYNPS